MTDEKARQEAKRRWGRTGMIRLDKWALTGEARKQAHQALMEHKDRQPSQKSPEYKAWKAEYRKLQSRALRRRCTVGQTVGDFLYEIKGQGDTWEEAFEGR